MLIFGSAELLTTFLRGDTFYAFAVSLIFSYIGGQLLRLKQLKHVEEACTKRYRKTKAKEYRNRTRAGQFKKQDDPEELNQSEPEELNQSEFEKAKEKLDNLEQQYFAGTLDIEELRNEYEGHNKRFGIWEEFPYPYQLRGRRLLRQSPEYNRFFDKYEKLGMTKEPTLFHFFKSAIYEYSASFKEEVLRQESLVRLFSGIYYAINFGVMVNVIVGSLHLAAIATFHLATNYCLYVNMEHSYEIVVIAVLSLLACWYTNREILRQLRFMRVKELNLAFDGYYLICKKRNRDFLVQ